MSENKEKIVVEDNSKDVNSEVLEEIKKACIKEAKFSKMAACFVGGLFAVVLISALILVPMGIHTILKVNKLVDDANTVVTNIDGITDDLNTMVSSVTTTSDNINTLLDDNSEDLTDAIKSLSEIDFEGLNTAISDLETAVKPLATLFGGQ